MINDHHRNLLRADGTVDLPMLMRMANRRTNREMQPFTFCGVQTVLTNRRAKMAESLRLVWQSVAGLRYQREQFGITWRTAA
jgi:hypothetical protein